MLNKNLKSTLTKTAAAAALTLAGAAIVNNTQNTVKAAEVTVGQQEKVVTINYLPHKSIAVWNSYGPDKQMTGQYLPHATAWKVIRAAYDDAGNKWYDLGANQWVMAKYTRLGKDTVDPNVASELFTLQASSYNTAAQTQTTQGSYSAPKTSVGTYSSVQSTQPAQSTQQTQPVQQQAQPAQSQSSYTSNVSGSEAAAKAWIAGRESGGSYSARNGQYIGKYQLSASYLGGDYSAANQERVADNYVKSRYGSWSNAQSFWQANGWY
ncbi:hypothetical protein [Lactobacillus johnsonii]|jgi:hypothetical protein|uniref:Uncharacterized protein n=3 Tax=Lactobacillus johnsonii TaxID=33959 RepID=A0A9W3Z2N9_LACJH|nr:hypothetical protein [Lactobacillus johnsonii]AZZ68376.1 hypothetical protein D7321_08235 [Lactobacillus johnsonii]MCI6881559.1 hypothetical protein [Lactobacillus johnsonii]MDY5067265.1 hypothetical protein [Lactobacillus johnsonii]MDY6042099.1 hypothetical protein [Lactobacillus johnsonii]OUL53094.1 hypothetical protein B2G48_07730 [Lactobacillus johnsonii]